MIPTWVCGYPTQDEKGIYLAMDMGGTNLRVCEIELLGKQKNDLGKDVGTFDLQQSKYRIPKELLTGDAQDLFGFLADCLKQFIEEYHDINKMKTLHLGFTFSYPCTQEYIDHGVLQRWTKGFDVPGVEGHDVVPMLENELKALGVPITVAALINDTTGTLIASRYTDNATEIGCIFGTGCNAAYMDRMGDIPKLAHMKLDPDMPIAINCEWGAFDNEHKVLPLTPYDTQIDKESPRPGQQTFEKMVSGLYIGEIFRLVLVDLAKREDVKMFEGQDISRLKKRYSLDAGFMSAIEEDPFENLLNTRELFEQKLDIDITKPEAELIRRLSEMIGTRAARLSACGIAAVCMRKKIDKCTVGADGSVVNKYPGFKDRVATALKQIYDWKETHHSHSDYPIHVEDSEDGSGVGAALIAALTKKRVEQGNLAGIQFPENYR